MSMYGRDPWGGPLEIHAADSATNDDRNLDFDKTSQSRPLDETKQSWLLGPGEHQQKKYVDLGCIIVSRQIFPWTVGIVLAAGFLAAFITFIVKTVPCHYRPHPPPDNYTLALHKALQFFNALAILELEILQEGRLLMIIIVGCLLKTLIMPGRYTNVIAAQNLLQKWLLL